MKRLTLVLIFIVFGFSLVASTLRYSEEGSKIKSIAIDISSRDIEIKPSSDSKVYLDYPDENLEVALKNNELSIKMAKATNWQQYIGIQREPEEALVLYIPSDIASLSINVKDGDIDIYPLAIAGELKIEVNNGDLAFDELSIEKSISLKAKNGDISGTLVGSYEDFNIVSKIKKGDSNLPSIDNSQGRYLKVSMNNGDVDIRFVK